MGYHVLSLTLSQRNLKAQLKRATKLLLELVYKNNIFQNEGEALYAHVLILTASHPSKFPIISGMPTKTSSGKMSLMAT